MIPRLNSDNHYSRWWLRTLSISLFYTLVATTKLNATQNPRIINFIVNLPAAPYHALLKMRQANSSLAQQHLTQVNDLVAPFLIKSSNYTLETPLLPTFDHSFINKSLNLRKTCTPGGLCDLTKKPSRTKRSPLRSIFKGLRRSRSRLGKKNRSKKSKKSLKIKTSPAVSKKANLINKIKIVYGGTGVVVMMGSLGLITLGIAEYAGWIPHVEDYGQIDYLSSQFQEFASADAKLTQSLYLMNLENTKTQFSMLEILTDLKNGLIQDEDITASLSYQLTAERLSIARFLEELMKLPPRQKPTSPLTNTFFKRISQSSNINPDFPFDCLIFKLTGYIPEKLRIYIAADFVFCPKDKFNKVYKNDSIQISLASHENQSQHIPTWNHDISERLSQSKNHTQTNFGNLLTLNDSVNQLVDKTKNMNNTSVKIWIPTSITTSLILAGILIVVTLARRRRTAPTNAYHLTPKNSLPLSIKTDMPGTLHIDETEYNSAKTTLHNTLLELLQKEYDSRHSPSVQTLQNQYDKFRDESTALANLYWAAGLTEALEKIDDERNTKLGPLFLEGLAKARKEHTSLTH